MAEYAHNANGNNDLFHRGKVSSAEIPMDYSETKAKPVVPKYESHLPSSWLFAFVILSLLLITSILVAAYVVSSRTEELSRNEVFTLALAVASDFTTGIATVAIAPAIYLLCSRRDDIHHKNPFVIQFMIYVSFCGSVHLLSVGYLDSQLSLFHVASKFGCALFSVTTVGSFYLLMDTIIRLPSRNSYHALQNENRLLQRKFKLLDSSTFCNKLRFTDSDEDMCCAMIQELAKVMPCDLLGSYHSAPHSGDINDQTDSILSVSSSNEQYALPKNVPFQLMEYRDEIIIFRKIDNRLLASLLSIENLYVDPDSIVSIPSLLENTLLSLPFSYFILISSCNPIENSRIDFLLCFVQPLKLDTERMILLRQCAAIGQFALSTVSQVNFLSTRAKQCEEDSEMLADEKERIRSQLDEKVKFITTVTNEMRTGLVNLQNSLQLVSGESGSLEYGSKIEEDTDSLVSYVNDVVDFVRPIDQFTEARQYVWEFNVEVQNTWNNVRENIAPKYGGQVHVASIPSDVPRYVIGDRNVFLRALNTLLSSSLELVGKGSVLMTVKCISFNSDNKFFIESTEGKKVRCIGNVMLQLDIVASGKGVSPLECEKMFDPLYKTNSPYSGLRLAIVRQEVTRCGGKIRLESSVSMGSTYSVVFPFIVVDIKADTRSAVMSPSEVSSSPQITKFPSKTPVRGLAASTEKEKPSKPVTKIQEKGSELHILIAEDNLLNQKVLVRLLAKLGQKDVTLVTQGDLAVEAVQKTSQPFDLIFMDLHMPVMGGIEACKLIREMNTPHYPQIIACTANAQNDVKAQFSKLGAYAFIPKPINFKKLSAALDEYFTL